MNTTTRKALSATTSTAVLLAVFEQDVTPHAVRELVEPFFLDPEAGTVVFLTPEGALECPTEFWADGSLGRLAHSVGWLEHTTRKAVALPRGVSVDFFGGLPITGWSETATVLNSLRTDLDGDFTEDATL